MILAIIYIYVCVCFFLYETISYTIPNTQTERQRERMGMRLEDDINELYKASLSGSTTTLDDLMLKDSLLL